MDVTRKRLFFDIETSFNIGWFWRAGYKQVITPEQIIHERKVICISYKWEGENKVQNLRWDRKQCDKKMLQEFIKIMGTADEIIAHNGDRFDIKWLRTRCLYHRIPTFPVYQSIDTLKISKSYFNFNSNKLDYIAKFLEVGEKMETGGVDLWKRVILDNDEEALQIMVDYCDQDVMVLEAVYQELKNYARHKTNYATLGGGDKYECPECGTAHVRLSKTSSTAMGTLKRHMKCKKCHKHYTISNRSYMHLLEYKVRNNIK